MAVHKDWKVTHYNHAQAGLGEATPENLSFNLYLNKSGDCQYDLDLSHPLAVETYTRPKYTDYVLQYGSRAIQSGIHLGINIDDDNGNILQVSGQDWLVYLDEGCFWPFDPTNPTASIYFATQRDIALITKDLLDTTLAQANRLAFTYAIAAIGQLADFQIQPGDTTSLLQMISALGQVNPGFDFDVSPSIIPTFNLYAGAKGNLANTYIFDEAVNCESVSFSNNGPKATHILGTGTSNSGGQAAYVVEAANQVDARRWDISETFDNVNSQAQLQQFAVAQAARDSADDTTFSLKYVPTLDEDIWGLVGIGDICRCRATFKGYKKVDDYYRVVGISGDTSDEGEVELSFTFDYGSLSL